MEPVVVYESLTGNTKAIAEQIAEGIGAKVCHVTQAPPNPELLVLGAPTHLGLFLPSMYQYKNSVNPKRMAVFTTYGAPGAFGEWTSRMTLNNLKKKGVPVLGALRLKGFHPIFRTNKGCPNPEELKLAHDFGAVLKKFVDNKREDYYMTELSQSWMATNLPFFCGMKQGFTGGLSPQEYTEAPGNRCSSKKWFTRGYVIGDELHSARMLGVLLATILAVVAVITKTKR